MSTPNHNPARPNAAPLVPCPFCGGRDIQIMTVSIDGGRLAAYFAFCQGCQAQGPKSFAGQANAGALWNLRIVRPLGAEAGPGDDLAEHERAIAEILDQFMEGK